MNIWQKPGRYLPHIIVKKIRRKLFRHSKAWLERKRDALFSTYSPVNPDLKLHQRLTPPPLEVVQAAQPLIQELVNLWRDHYFDLLGSGWVQVQHGLVCRGVEGYRYPPQSAVQPDSDGAWLKHRINRANQATARQIWQPITPTYHPIDWHLDFKSGYRWAEDTWFIDITYGKLPGVDVKVPWELARMQHLPCFAWHYYLTHDARIVQEFQDQILDFIATNPPRYGVNWKTTMDVAIRVANWLVSYDLLRAMDAPFSAAFTSRFCQSVYEHGQHIVNHLEWSDTLRGNHYLANIAGLLFVAGYLEGAPEISGWWDMAVQAFITEVELQFNADGSNFEASTSYHRLSTEMVAYATALLKAVEPDRSLPFAARLENAARFTIHTTKPTGEIAQIGDNDNGRFFKFQPLYSMMTVDEARRTYQQLADYAALPDEALYPDEQFLDHTHLLNTLDALYGQAVRGIDGHLTAALCQSQTLPSQLTDQPPAQPTFTRDLQDWRTSLEGLTTHQLEIPVHDPAIYTGLACFAYPDFGLYLFRSPRLFLAVRCGSIGQNGNGGHAHLDQLHVELQIDGIDLIQDRGTYVYTPLPQRRNQYRSTLAHCVPTIGEQEPGNLHKGLFTLQNDQMRATCLYVGQDGFVGVHHGFGTPVYRIVHLAATAIHIEDYADHPRLNPIRYPQFAYSPKYGFTLAQD